MFKSTQCLLFPLARKQFNDCIWDYSIRHVPMLIACCLKGPHLHYAVCNVLSLSLFLSFLLANINWKGNQTTYCTCHWNVSQVSVNGMAWAGARKRGDIKSLDSNCRLCCLLILIILKGMFGCLSICSHTCSTNPEFTNQSEVHFLYIYITYMTFTFKNFVILGSA